MIPEAGNPVAGVDSTFLFIFGVSAAILVGITCAMIVFVVRYNRKRHPVPADFDGNLLAEIVWTVVPTILVLFMFLHGWASYRALRDAPADAMPVAVTARMWTYSFQYEDGRRTSQLYVPVGRPVKLTLTAVDVLHGFFVPAFRIKIDTVPGMTTHAWFRADEAGEYDIFCSVYCGTKHADMLSKVVALPPEEFERWQAEGRAPALDGRALLDRHGCLSCHSLDGSESLGPTFKGLAGRATLLVAPDGRDLRVTADEAYIRSAIAGERPGAVKGFDPLMPVFKGQIPDDEIRAMAAFLAGKSPQATPGGHGAMDHQAPGAGP